MDRCRLLVPPLSFRRSRHSYLLRLGVSMLSGAQRKHTPRLPKSSNHLSQDDGTHPEEAKQALLTVAPVVANGALRLRMPVYQSPVSQGLVTASRGRRGSPRPNASDPATKRAGAKHAPWRSHQAIRAAWHTHRSIEAHGTTSGGRQPPTFEASAPTTPHSRPGACSTGD